MRWWLLLGTAALQSCATPSAGIRPLRPLEIPTAPYQETITAALTGTLMYERGCLMFRDEATHLQLLAVWPTGTVFNGTSVIFHQPGKADWRVVLGEEFLMSGQQLRYTGLPGAPYQLFEQQCGVQPFFVAGVRPAN